MLGEERGRTAPGAQGIQRRSHALRSSSVSGVEGGWHPSPGAPNVGVGRLPHVEPGRVVGLGAICDLGPERYDSRDQGFFVSEFVTLQDGRRVILHEDRGFAVGVRSSDQSDPGDLRQRETLDSLTEAVLTTVLPDEDDCTDEHPWSWLADLARARGLNVTVEDMRDLPYDVIFTGKVRRWLASAEES